MSEAGNELVLMAGLVSGVPLLGLTGVLRLLYRPRDPGQGEVVMELGPDAPAIVDLLTDRFEVTPHAPVATLVDLAARRWVDIEEPVPDEVVVRVRTRPGQGELTSFEHRVLQRVREVAVTGAAPAAALAKGTSSAAKAWQRGFRNEVIAVARAQGLCRARRPPAVQALPFAAGALAALAFYFGAPDRNDRDSSASASASFDRVAGLSLAAMVLGAVALMIGGRMVRRSAVRGTDLGLQRARSWLGVRRFLADHGRFEDYPAASVRIWDRYLAHAVALDLAPLAARQLPLGAESDRWAWSRYGGRWQLVKVVYPKLRPGWGRPPWLTVPVGMAVSVLGWWVGRPLGSALLELATDLPDSFPDKTWLVWLSRPAAGSAPLAIAAWVAAGPAQTLFALVDIATTQHIEGLVLRHRAVRTNSNGHTVSYWVAVQTGQTERIRAYRVSAKLASGVQQGAIVRLRVTRLLGWVRQLKVAPIVPAAPTATAGGSVGGRNVHGAANAGPATTGAPDQAAAELLRRADQLIRRRDQA